MTERLCAQVWLAVVRSIREAWADVRLALAWQHIKAARHVRTHARTHTHTHTHTHTPREVAPGVVDKGVQRPRIAGEQGVCGAACDEQPCSSGVSGAWPLRS
jgi:hypothetical protein